MGARTEILPADASAAAGYTRTTSRTVPVRASSNVTRIDRHHVGRHVTGVDDDGSIELCGQPLRGCAIAARGMVIDERSELPEVGAADVDSLGHFNLRKSALPAANKSRPGRVTGRLWEVITRNGGQRASARALPNLPTV